jgi:hypothetical protein
MTPVVLIVPFAVPSLTQAAMITVVNLDGPNEGFNDPTPVAPVGGNSGTTLGAQRLIAFQAAANLWGTRLTSSVEILVGANFDPLPCDDTSAVLGAAGPDTVHRDFIGAPVANTWYPQALANSLAGFDIDPGSDDISATFSSTIGTPGCLSSSGWYYGLDGNSPGNRIDFVSVLLHELGHGLGFLTFVDLATGVKLSGFNDTYMLNLENHSTGKLYPDMSNAERVAASTNTGNLHWVGPNVVAASGFLTNGRHPTGHVEMFAPNPQQPGSSVSHFSNTLFPHELMEPFYTGPNHDVELTLELFADIGWNLLEGGIAAIGVFRPSSRQWFLDLNGNGRWDGCTTDDCLGPFGLVNDLAVAGDWDGTGMTKIGVFRSGNWYLDFNGSGHWEGSAGGDRVFSFGLSNDRPVVGDWTGGGDTKIGVFRPSTAQWYVDRNGNGRWDGCSVDGCLGPFGLGTDLPVAGDWNGTGIAQIGVFRNGSWYLDLNGNGKWDGCGVDRCYSFGLSSDRPVVGDWNGSGTTKVGVYRNGSWYLDLNGNGKWDGCGVDRCYSFGLVGDLPVSGAW